MLNGSQRVAAELIVPDVVAGGWVGMISVFAAGLSVRVFCD
ncbi:hypothetical protein [Corynebacterium stationis]|nr:hypothetical protein [Corynebacterium stationis]